MSDKSITIIFPQGGIIPASVIGAKEDLHVEVLKPVEVPTRYGRHLIDDRFAVEAPATAKVSDNALRKASVEKKAAAEKAEAEKKAAAEKAEAEKKAAAEKAEAEKQAAAEKAAAIAKAEADVLEARALRDASGDDLAAKADAEKMLSAAEQALADLKA